MKPEELIVMIAFIAIPLIVFMNGCSDCEDRGGVYVKDAYGFYTCVEKR